MNNHHLYSLKRLWGLCSRRLLATEGIIHIVSLRELARCFSITWVPRETMINAYAGYERPRGWSFLTHHWELIIVSLAFALLCQ